MQPNDPLDARAIAAALGARGVALDVRVETACASTNAELLARGDDRPALLVADRQTRGRGRRGRRWHSAAGSGVLLSLRRPMHRPLRELAGLPLAAGVAALRALRGFGLDCVSLKWPNDLLVEGAKLGGILVETRAAGRAVAAVVGIGINWHGAPGAQGLRRDAACVADFLQPAPARNLGAAALAGELLAVLDVFDARGLDVFREEWEAAHAYAGVRVRVRLGGGRTLTGTAQGLGEDGSLQLRTRGGVRAVHSGSLRAA